MKPSRSIQRSWNKLESFFKPNLQRTPSLRPKSSKGQISIFKSFSRSPSKMRKASAGFHVEGVPQNLLDDLYHAKCSDLQIPMQRDHKSKFFLYCSTHFYRKDLKLIEYSLGPKSGKVLGDILLRNPHFSYVKLAKNFLGDEGIMSLLKGVTNNTSIVHLDISNNNITQEGAVSILKILSGHKTLYSLNISSKEALHKNKLGRLGGLELEAFLAKNRVIGVLNLYGSSISDSIFEISRGIEQNKSLISLNIGGNCLSPADVGVLMSGIRSSKLIILDVSDNFIGNEGCEAISDILAADFSIEQIYVAGNGIGLKGFRSILSALYSNFNLKKLDISYNPLGSFPTDISYAFENNTCLKEINLAACELKSEALGFLGKMLSKNKGLQVLNLAENAIEDNSLSAICKALMKNFVLTTLNLSRNKLKNAGAKELAEALKINQGIVDMNLKENAIKDHGADELCEATRLNKIILRLNLEQNLISSKYLEQISRNLKNNTCAANKMIPIRVRQHLASFDFHKSTLQEVHKKCDESFKEKEEMLQKIAKQSEKLDEAKKQENQKYEEIHNVYMELREKSYELSRDLEVCEREMIVSKTVMRNEIKKLEQNVIAVNKETAEKSAKRDLLQSSRILAGEKQVDGKENLAKVLELEQRQLLIAREEFLFWRNKLENVKKTLVSEKEKKDVRIPEQPIKLKKKVIFAE